jgi:molecular chaperone GrpE
MNERDRRQGKERPKIKVTDRRRVHDEEAGAVGAGEGSSAGEASGRNEAPLASAGPRPHEGSEDVAAELEAAKRQAAEYLEHLQRLKAEFDNYRKRVLKEQTRAVEMASEPLIRRLLEVLDEFDLALMAAERTPDFERFLHGVELVYAKLQDILRSEGLERIQAEGQPFDPELHEALMQSGEAEGEPVVADVLRPGYTMKGRVIRPASVKVARR